MNKMYDHPFRFNSAQLHWTPGPLAAPDWTKHVQPRPTSLADFAARYAS